MRNNKQILDVTYGSFSCRLEGFDDSVATMKQIAEFLSTLRDSNGLPDASETTIDVSALAKLTGAIVDETPAPDQKPQLRLRHPQFAPDADLAEEEDDSPDALDSDNLAARMDRIRAVIGHGAMPEETGDDDSVDGPRSTPFAARLADLAQRKAMQPDAPHQPDDDGDMDFAEPGDDAGFTMVPDVAAAADDADPDADPRPKRLDLSSTADATVARILSQADDEINAPALRHQRLSFAQLKAASVATDAARQLGDDSADDTALNATFRHDLDDLAAAAAQPDQTEDVIDFTTDGPDDADDAPEKLPPLILLQPITPPPLPPLRLVAAQRVVDPVPPVGAEQRLRQIVSRIATGPTTPVSYADFVAAHKITDMSDMILAAAAYVTFVQGNAAFSRPQVMRLVRSHAKDAVAREQGVRLFGRLVTENRIIRLNDGLFRVADDTPYRPATQPAP